MHKNCLVGASAAFFLLSSGLAWAENLPEMRPALCGSYSDSLVNRIDPQTLMKQGMTHGAVLFHCLVLANGQTDHRYAYGGTPGSEPLRREVVLKLMHAMFTPAMCNHHNTYAWFYGAVTFSVIDGKPHIRVYANQERSELAKGSDFVGPQGIYIPGHIYDLVPRMREAFGSWQTEDVPGTVEFEVTVPIAGGQAKSLVITKETPPGKGYGKHALETMKEITWTPAYRNGRPVETPTHITFIFIPGGWSWKS